MKKKKESLLESLFWGIISLVAIIVEVIFLLLLFVYNLITFKTSGYKEKVNVGFFKTYFNKGNYGEFIFYKKLVKIVDKEDVFVNIYLGNENTEFTEIDLAAVTKKGVYVFEVKNYRGMIYGSQNDKYWIQYFHKKSKFQFYNPIRQNYAHVKALEKTTSVEEFKIIPVVAFNNKSKLQKINVFKTMHVYHFQDALKLVKRNEKYNDDVFSEQEVLLIKNIIAKYTHVSELIKEKHIDDVTRYVEIISEK